jgi:hypothetical protein
MKTLDLQDPTGYFESLSETTLARLEASMQSNAESERDSSPGIPPREEDSGLHDIRSLAQSAKMRAATRRSSQQPSIDDDELLAASSGAWNAVALPEPAKMVSLPALDELPAAKDVIAKDRATRVAAPAAGQRRGKMFAVVGLGVAAAAGVTIFLMTRESADRPTAPQVAIQAPAPATTPVAAPRVTAEPPAAAPTAGAAGSADTAPPADVKVAAPAAQEVTHKAAAKGKPKQADTSKGAAPEVKKAAAPDDKKPADKGKADKGKDDEPSFEALLKEAGVDSTKKPDRPKLDKKELSGDDFKRGIGAVAKKAQGCYKGTQGTAVVKITIAPSGAVSKASVVGAFAGTPEGDCVTRAVQGASFPAWDGGPQSFTYSYLLSE